MTDKELFEQVLDKIQNDNCIEIERPYGDAYVELRKNGIYLGDMNYEGRSFTYCIYKLGKILDYWHDTIFR